MEVNWRSKKDCELIANQIGKDFEFRGAIEKRFSSKNNFKKFFDEIIYSNESNKIWSSQLNPNDFLTKYIA